MIQFPPWNGMVSHQKKKGFTSCSFFLKLGSLAPFSNGKQIKKTSSFLELQQSAKPPAEGWKESAADMAEPRELKPPIRWLQAP